MLKSMEWGRQLLRIGLAISLLPAAICSGSAAGEKIDARILYAGRAGSERQDDFVQFLRVHFAEVATCDLGAFSEEAAGRFDVIVLDHDQDKHPRMKFSDDYGVPTVTVGMTGAHIGSTNRLKTGYL